ncbi:TetR/AcrR family transcriptional regulator [Mycolicibacterium thermoresistibile]|uniref:TetR family transcriptional regulator n=1 Tax=Mycolicibacterium thermoresistibile TaxID=1797 RepID=A0A100XEI9_MYCTH|nr:TetR/AcrR family transcriptional regulator [Mycolicibacterium thermoresistibile]MCV7189454.1 TetR/AcrR family transcriptional regulator [Mycolicibacterium thermoresistibile]GAT15122.1 TetR family transcriptional regulator [Mycolicibacterium thermoresistibile]SNW16329.1 TetR family transcriptional regulator [Mycolicibacterium thermoresistibile]
MPPNPARRGPGRPPAAKAEETRARIVRAAREVFSELGYDAATFQEIAVRADLTRPAINHYFPSKQVLYQEVVQQTNSLVVAEGMERAKRETTLLGRLSAFFTAAMQAESEDRSTAAFLVISVLESQRHPELTIDEFDALKNSRAFVTWAVNDAIERGELTTNTDVSKIVEMLVAVLWGMGFYAGYVGRQEDLKTVVEQFELLLANKLWQLKS